MNSIITVTSQTTMRQLVEPAYARQVMGWTTADISDDLLSSMIDGASAFVESWCDRRLIDETVIEEFILDQPVKSLWLSLRPVSASPLVTVVDGTVELTTDQWRLNYDTGKLSPVGVSWWPPRFGICNWLSTIVAVTYRGGYTTAQETGGTNIPADLRDGTLELLKDHFQSISIDPAVRSEEVPGAWSATYSSGSSSQASASAMPTAAQIRLQRYRRETRFA